LSYINRNRARQTGTNRTTQAEISNGFWLSFPGRVNRPKSPTGFGSVFRGGSQAEISNGFWLSFPGRVTVIAVVTLLGWLGWREFNLSKTAENAQQQIESTASKARVDISQASAQSIGEVQKESGKAIDANRNSEETAAMLSEDLKSTASKTKTELNSEASDVRSEVAKSKSELESVHKLQPEFDSMRAQLGKATSNLAAQQKVLSNSEEFVKQVFSTHVTYMFAFKDFVQPNAVVIPAPQGTKNTVVLMLVPNSPIDGTLQLQYRVALQPPGSYFHIHNLILFFWGDPAENLKTDMLSVSFFPDTSDKETIRTLTVRDGRVYADDQPLPKFGQPDPDWKGNKWMPLAQPAKP